MTTLPLSSVPGVRIVDVGEPAPPTAPTGVPGFVGLARPRAAQAAPVLALDRGADFDALLQVPPDGYLAAAVAAFFANGGQRCHVAWAEPVPAPEAALRAALARLAGVDEVDLVAMPDAALAGSRAATLALQGALLDHAARHGGCLAVLDAWAGAGADSVLAQRDALLHGRCDPVDGALYHPWVRGSDGRLAPPSGHVCGVIARCDAGRGVFKAPANEVLAGAIDLESVLDDTTHGELHAQGVNVLRARPGRGIRVAGARTLSRDPAWRHVPARRLVLDLGRWIEQTLAAAVLEPHGPALWSRLRREIEARLETLRLAGALHGDTADEAYSVQCDAALNPPERRDLGEVCTEIGLALSVPAEQVLVRLIHRPGSRELDAAD